MASAAARERYARKNEAEELRAAFDFLDRKRDGTLDADEDALIRRIAGLIYVADQDRGAARKRVLKRLGIGP